jgi:hypothetical protein
LGRNEKRADWARAGRHDSRRYDSARRSATRQRVVLSAYLLRRGDCRQWLRDLNCDDPGGSRTRDLRIKRANDHWTFSIVEHRQVVARLFPRGPRLIVGRRLELSKIGEFGVFLGLSHNASRPLYAEPWSRRSSRLSQERLARPSATRRWFRLHRSRLGTRAAINTAVGDTAASPHDG